MIWVSIWDFDNIGMLQKKKWKTQRYSRYEWMVWTTLARQNWRLRCFNVQIILLLLYKTRRKCKAVATILGRYRVFWHSRKLIPANIKKKWEWMLSKWKRKQQKKLSHTHQYSLYAFVRVLASAFNSFLHFCCCYCCCWPSINFYFVHHYNFIDDADRDVCRLAARSCLNFHSTIFGIHRLRHR